MHTGSWSSWPMASSAALIRAASSSGAIELTLDQFHEPVALGAGRRVRARDEENRVEELIHCQPGLAARGRVYPLRERADQVALALGDTWSLKCAVTISMRRSSSGSSRSIRTQRRRKGPGNARSPLLVITMMGKTVH